MRPISTRWLSGPPPADQQGVEALIAAYQDSWITGDLNVLAAVGSGAWLVALAAAALALRRQGADTGAVVCLALSGLLLAIGHPAPFGPLAMVLLLAAVWRLAAASRHAGPTHGIEGRMDT